MRNIALLVVGIIGMGVAVPAADAQYQYTQYNGTTIGQPNYRQQIWRGPDNRWNRRQEALIRSLQRQVDALERRLRSARLSFRERVQLRKRVADLRLQIANVRHDNRRY